MLLQVIYSIAVLIIVATVCIIAFMFRYGVQIIRNKPSENTQLSVNAITFDKVVTYFKKFGYIVCHSTPVLNTNEWVAFIIKDGKYQIVTVFTEGNTIVGHDYSLA